MRKTIILFLALCLTFMFTADVLAREEGIAAVVNEDAISFSDLNDRMTMIIASSGLPDSEEIRQKLAQQVINSLIEEQLKLQEARSAEINVDEEEIQKGLATIAQQNQIPVDKFEAMIKGSGINIATMHRQIESQIAWTKVVQAKIRPKITVTDTDIDSRFAQLASNKGEVEYRLAEIFLPVDTPESEADTRQLAQNLVKEIKSGKAPFFKLAQQFSKAAGAAQGGDMGWVQHSQIAEELSEGAQKLTKNEVSAPIRSISGYHILHLLDQREISDETLPTREQVMSIIGTERLERLQRRYLLDLKSAAFVENRVGS